MKALRNIISALTMLALCSLAAVAQQYGYGTLLAGGTNSVLGTETRVYTTAAGLTKYEDCTLWVSFKAVSTATGVVDFKLHKSLDGVLWDTTQTALFRLTSDGTTLVNGLTNIALGAIGYIKLGSSINTQAVDLTNITIRVYTKPKRFGS